MSQTLDELAREIRGSFVFLSGPMTGLPDWNRWTFDVVRRGCELRGALFVFDPARHAPREGERVFAHETYMLGTLHELTRTCKGGAAYGLVLMLPGWEESAGARLEHKVALECGIPVREVRLDESSQGERE